MAGHAEACWPVLADLLCVSVCCHCLLKLAKLFLSPVWTARCANLVAGDGLLWILDERGKYNSTRSSAVPWTSRLSLCTDQAQWMIKISKQCVLLRICYKNGVLWFYSLHKNKLWYLYFIVYFDCTCTLVLPLCTVVSAVWCLIIIISIFV